MLQVLREDLGEGLPGSMPMVVDATTLTKRIKYSLRFFFYFDTRKTAQSILSAVTCTTTRMVGCVETNNGGNAWSDDRSP